MSTPHPHQNHNENPPLLLMFNFGTKRFVLYTRRCRRCYFLGLTQVSVQEKSAVKERPPTTPEEKRADHAPQDAVPLYTMSQVSDHCEFSDCWVVIFDRVYDITDFLNQVIVGK